MIIIIIIILVLHINFSLLSSCSFGGESTPPHAVALCMFVAHSWTILDRVLLLLSSIGAT